MIYKIFSSIFKKVDPEISHSLAIQILKKNFIPFEFFTSTKSKILETNILGKNFASPIGLAAGFDKNAEIYNTIFKLGFSFAEIGTVTPLAQYGNPKPRVFRLNDDMAIINRLGFPSLGMEEVYSNIKKNKPNGILGINIGPNKDSISKVEDYLKCFKIFCNLGDYICINISSPNTPNLRDLHEKKKIEELLTIIKIKQTELKNNTPIIIKISPDINDDNIKELSNILIEKKIDGVALTNTTIKNRNNLKSKNKDKIGGLSGVPLQSTSNLIIKKFYKILQDRIPIIGAGGVSDGKSAFEKIKSGASLIQLYTSIVYQGPLIANNINKELEELLITNGFKNLKEAVGVDAV